MTPAKANVNSQHVIALDVGGTTVKASLMDDALRSTAALSLTTPRRQGPGAVLDTIARAIARLRLRADELELHVAHVGVAVPGVVDDDTGSVVHSSNLGFDHVPLASLLRDRTGLPVAVGHDVRAGGLAEARLGAARGTRNALFVAIGTGIAAALIADGRMLHGGGYAGEVGHIVVDPLGPRCACGNRGCLESIASAAALTTAMNDRVARKVTGSAEVAARLKEGDRDAQDVWTRAVHALATALAMLTTTLAPEVIVVGGGLCEADDLLLAPLRTELLGRLSFQRRPILTKAALGARAGVLGAGLLAWRAAGGRPLDDRDGHRTVGARPVSEESPPHARTLP
ncbi:ROK family protein [Streptomyces globisporus]|uniref:ROK family protein n=1 Tax=Streptomyces globisporus TaxID=1908 RepID=UPI0007C433D0|nr:ROK family protein [Streptomyces globisporus]